MPLFLRLTALMVLAMMVLAACGGDDEDGDATATPNLGTGEPTHIAEMTATAEAGTDPVGTDAPEDLTAPDATGTEGDSTDSPANPAAPTEEPAADQPVQNVRLTPEQLQEYRPNELGWIPLLQYHHFGPVPDDLTRTPEQFRGDLQWLYDNDFYVISIRDYISHNINVPAGKRPVMLSFDDSAVSQFSVIPQENGQIAVDPNSAVAIMEAFFNEHPDFGRGGHFAILPDRAFAWPDAFDQMEYAQMKLEWLVSNGYELGNHTLDHENLGLVSTEEIQYQLVAAERETQKYIPDARLEIVTLPYGGYPHGGDDSVFYGFHYEGEWFEYEAVLLVGANPSYSPVSTEYHPFWIPRIQAFDEELGRWQEFILENPDIMYVSDGNPDTVTIPHELSWALVDTLDESKMMGRELIRY